MKIQLLIISLLFMTNGLCARGLDKAFQLLPQPQSVELLPGKGIMYTDLKFVSAASDTLVPILGALTDVQRLRKDCQELAVPCVGRLL